MKTARRKIYGVFAVLFIMASPAFAQEPAAPADLTNLTLSDAVMLALANSEAGQISREQINQAKATVLESESPAWPSVTGIVGYTYNIEEPYYMQSYDFLNPLMAAMNLPAVPPAEVPLVYRHNWDFTLSVSQNIFTFGRIGSAIRMAKLYEDIAMNGADVTDQDTVTQVVEAYYGVVLAKEFAKIAEQNLKLSQMNYDSVKAKTEAGLKSEFDLLRAKAEVAESRPNVIEMNGAITVAKLNLLRVIGATLDRPVDTVDPFRESFPASEAAKLVGEAKTGRTELTILRQEEEMNHAKGNIYRSNYLPVIAANMNYTQSGQSITDNEKWWPEEDDFNTFWSVGATFTWPLFDGFQSLGKMRQARAEERVSRLKRVQAEKGIEVEVTQLAARMDTLTQQVAARRETVDVAWRAFELAQVRYDSGLGTQLEKADAKALWTQARVRLYQVLYDLNVTQARLTRALGKRDLS